MKIKKELFIKQRSLPPTKPSKCFNLRVRPHLSHELEAAGAGVCEEVAYSTLAFPLNSVSWQCLAYRENLSILAEMLGITTGRSHLGYHMRSKCVRVHLIWKKEVPGTLAFPPPGHRSPSSFIPSKNPISHDGASPLCSSVPSFPWEHSPLLLPSHHWTPVSLLP